MLQHFEHYVISLSSVGKYLHKILKQVQSSVTRRQNKSNKNCTFAQYLFSIENLLISATFGFSLNFFLRFPSQLPTFIRYYTFTGLEFSLFQQECPVC